MSTKKIFGIGLAILVLTGLIFSLATSVLAAGEGTLADPYIIDGLPFSESVNTTSATVGPDDPLPSCPSWWPRSATRWYQFTPISNMQVKASAGFNAYDFTNMAVFTRNNENVLTEYGCTSASSGLPPLLLSLNADTTYYFMLSGNGIASSPYPPPDQSMSFNLVELIPLGNDNFESAQAVDILPFSSAIDLSAATLESAEPTPSCAGLSEGTVWYSFTPALKALLSVRSAGGVIAIYTGASLGNLIEVVCLTNWNQTRIEASPGITYYLQSSSATWGSGFSLEEVLPPANDNFFSAQVVTSLPFSDSPDTSLATVEFSEPKPSCREFIYGTAWYAFTPTTEVFLEVKSDGGVIAVYTGPSLDNLTEIGCQPVMGTATRIETQPGTTYYLQVAIINSSSRFSLRELIPPANDLWANAEVITETSYYFYPDLSGAKLEPNEPTPSCMNLDDGTVWYTYTPSEGKYLRIRNQYMGMAVYSGTSIQDLREVDCLYNSMDKLIDTQAGITYYIQVSMELYGDNSYFLQEVSLPANDNFANAQPVASFPYSEYPDPILSTTEPSEPSPSCLGLTSGTVWYSYTPDVNGLLSVTSSGGLAAVYTGSALENLTEVGCVAGEGEIRINTEPGITHYIQVSANQWGYRGFSLDEIIWLPNDNFTAAQAVTDLPFSATVDLRGATVEPAEPSPSCDGLDRGSAWYTYTPSADTYLNVTVNTSAVAIYTGSSIDSLTEVACISDYYRSTLVDTKPGKVYYIQVAKNWWGERVGFSLDVVAPPPNDHFANAQPVTLPFSDTPSVTTAKVELSEPAPSCKGLSSGTVWYSFTPTEDTSMWVASNGGLIAIYNGDSFNNLNEVECLEAWGQSIFHPQTGTTYFIQVSQSDYYYSSSFSLETVTPPANDDFASAEAITTLPFTGSPSLTYASMESNELACYWNPWSSPPDQSVWYRYTAENKETLHFSNYWGYVAVYTGSAMEDLNIVSCLASGGSRTLVAEAGTTFYIQVLSGDGGGSSGFELVQAPLPIVSQGYSPQDPSTYDEVYFWCYGSDPVDIGIQSYLWEFGDGTTGERPYPTHTYNSDGDYTVHVTVTSFDGRTTTTSMLVLVRTNDIAITNFKTPEQVKAGQKHKFGVDITSSHYLESVKVELFKNTPTGFTPFASMVQLVPAGKPIAFTFNYLFSEQDVSDKVNTFRAVATPIWHRDVKPDNNAMTVGANKDLKDWMVYQGSWEILNGKLTTTSLAENPESFIWAGNPLLTTQGDLTASFTLNLTNDAPGDWAGRHGGIMFFSSVPTARGDTNMNGYTIDWLDGYDTGFRLFRWGNDKTGGYLASSGCTGTCDPGKQWLVKVEGEWIRFYVDDVLRLEVQDNTYRSGHFGFWAHSNNTKIEVSNLKIGDDFKALIPK